MESWGEVRSSPPFRGVAGRGQAGPPVWRELVGVQGRGGGRGEGEVGEGGEAPQASGSPTATASTEVGEQTKGTATAGGAATETAAARAAASAGAARLEAEARGEECEILGDRTQVCQGSDASAQELAVERKQRRIEENMANEPAIVVAQLSLMAMLGVLH